MRMYLFPLLVALTPGLQAQAAPSLTVDEGGIRLRAVGDHFVVDVPIHASAPSAKMDVELLDTYGHTRSHAITACGEKGGHPLCRVTLPPASPANYSSANGESSLALFRLHYAVTSSGLSADGIVSLDHIAPTLFEIHTVEPRTIHRGASYSARIRTVNPLTGEPRAHIALTAMLYGSFARRQDRTTLEQVNITTDTKGFATFHFTTPDDAALESAELRVEGRFGNLKFRTAHDFEVPQNTRFQLRTDKPLYQPGQTVHARMLLLDRNGHAHARQPITLDVIGPDSTLVFRVKSVTSEYGIAAVDWPVPARMRLGDYSLRAASRESSGEAASTSAMLKLSRYDLPSFTVAAKADRGYYLPGQNATVDVRANYLFGKPVLHGHVRVVREDSREWNFREQRYDIREGKAVEGDLDAANGFTAKLDLAEDGERMRDDEPGRNFEDLHYAAYVTDASTGRTEQRRFDVRVSFQVLHVFLVGTHKQTRGLPEKLAVTVTGANGVPSESDLDVALLPIRRAKETFVDWVARAVPLRHLHTDALGLATLDLPSDEALHAMNNGSPDRDGVPELYLIAHDAEGRSGGLTETLNEPDQVLRVTAEKALYRAGDKIELTIESAEPSLPIHVELLRSTLRGDLLLAARDTVLAGGRSQLTFPTDERFSGQVFVIATSLRNKSAASQHSPRTDDAGQAIVFASRALLFPRDNALHVEVTMSHPSYRPGDEAVAKLAVHGPQDPDGDITAAAPSALGLVAVDEAVEERNRTDKDFGQGDDSFFFRGYARFWQPNFGEPDSVGGLTLQDLDHIDVAKPLPVGVERAAGILLGNLALEPAADTSVSGNDLAWTFHDVIDPQINPIRILLNQRRKLDPEMPITVAGVDALLAEHGFRISELRDPWGRPYQILMTPLSYSQMQFEFGSDGPDKQPGTADDFRISLGSWNWFLAHRRQLQTALESYHMRTGGFVRDLPALREEMQHEGIDFDAWRDPWGQPFHYDFGVQRTQFTVQAFSDGDPARDRRSMPGPFPTGQASVEYFSATRATIETALNRYSAKHGYPATMKDLDDALKASGLSLAKLPDVWGHSMYATFRTHHFFTDRVQTEARAKPGEQPQTHTMLTPITATADQIRLRSAGPDGIEGTDDDFELATLTHLQTEQSAKDPNPATAANQTVRSSRTGALLGIVSDVTGAVIPGAQVVATEMEHGHEYEAKTDEGGGYLLDPIPAGKYNVRISAPGFMDLLFQQVNVLTPMPTELNASLNIGSANEQVMVMAEAVTLNTESASVSGLPISGRQFYALAQLQPGAGGQAEPTSTPRTRDYFPETLLWRPEVITNADGTATARFHVADSITSWKLSASASTLEGNIGAGMAKFRTFQPFFAAFDPPRILTVGDTVALPVTLRNYLNHPVNVKGELKAAPWFRMTGPATSATEVAAQESSSPVFRFTATQPVTDTQQTFVARIAGAAGDSVARPVTVHPDGQESAVTVAAVIRGGENALTLTIPRDVLAGGGDTTLKIYPNLAAHLRDALVAMAHYPDGCAEQIISLAWPSLLLERYATRLPHPDKKLRQTTHRYLQEAYENLLEKQLSNGGFAYWSSDRDADPALTAYVIEFLSQAREFIDLDEQVEKQAIAFLKKQQQPDGLWIRTGRDGKPYPEDRAGNAMLTTSIAAMLGDAPDAEPLIHKALDATQAFVAEFDEPYTLASYTLASFAVKDTARGHAAALRLRSLALSENGGAYWALETNTPFFGWGRAGRVESTSQALRALLAAGANSQDELVARGLLFLDHEQDRQSLWYSTQASARALDVFAAIALATPMADSRGGVLSLRIDGEPAKSIRLPAANEDAGPIFLPLGSTFTAGEHRLTLTLPAQASAATAQAIASFYRPWPKQAATAATTNHEELRMKVDFSTRTPAPGQPGQRIDASVHVERIGFRGYGMLIAEIGLPPGAEVDRASLESAMKASGYQMNHYEVLPEKVLVYLWPRAGGFDLHFRFALRYAVDALTAPSVIYDYYNPDARFDLAPARFTQ